MIPPTNGVSFEGGLGGGEGEGGEAGTGTGTPTKRAAVDALDALEPCPDLTSSRKRGKYKKKVLPGQVKLDAFLKKPVGSGSSGQKLTTAAPLEASTGACSW